MDVQCCSRLPLAHFNIINLSGKFCSILKHTLGSKLNLNVKDAPTVQLAGDLMMSALGMG